MMIQRLIQQLPKIGLQRPMTDSSSAQGTGSPELWAQLCADVRCNLGDVSAPVGSSSYLKQRVERKSLVSLRHSIPKTYSAAFRLR